MDDDFNAAERRLKSRHSAMATKAKADLKSELLAKRRAEALKREHEHIALANRVSIEASNDNKTNSVYSAILHCGPPFERETDKVCLPHSALEAIERGRQFANIPSPLVFQLRNCRTGRTTHCGVEEFSAAEGEIRLPPQVSASLACSNDPIEVEWMVLPKGTSATFTAGSEEALTILANVQNDLQSLLQASLHGHTTLTRGDVLKLRVPGYAKGVPVVVSQVAPSKRVLAMDHAHESASHNGHRLDAAIAAEEDSESPDGVCIIDTDLTVEFSVDPLLLAKALRSQGEKGNNTEETDKWMRVHSIPLGSAWAKLELFPVEPLQDGSDAPVEVRALGRIDLPTFAKQLLQSNSGVARIELKTSAIGEAAKEEHRIKGSLSPADLFVAFPPLSYASPHGHHLSTCGFQFDGLNSVNKASIIELEGSQIQELVSSHTSKIAKGMQWALKTHQNTGEVSSSSHIPSCIHFCVSQFVSPSLLRHHSRLFAGIQAYVRPLTSASPNESRTSMESALEVRDPLTHQECPHCTKWIAKSSFLMHELHCSRFFGKCESCSAVLRKEQLARHVHCEICDEPMDSSVLYRHKQLFHSTVKCESCSMSLPSSEALTAHLQSTCPHRLILCQFCGTHQPAGSDTGMDPVDKFNGLSAHEAYCGSKTVPCGRSGCTQRVRLKEMVTHLAVAHGIFPE